MTQPTAFESLFRLETRLGASWNNIRNAREATTALHAELTSQTEAETNEDASIVVVGSLGRFEVTTDSDIDWAYLVDGQAGTKHQQAALRVAGAELLRSKGPGREGIFGNVAFSHGLLHYIGGADDTNANLTRRILLLSESKPVGRADAYERTIKALLDRYLSGDDGWMHRRTPHGVPRFLQNDISRYWRTVAVDFAYKQWTRDNEGWGLKSAKLRLSRKLIYAAGLLYCFSLAEGIWTGSSGGSSSERKLKAMEHLLSLTGRTPLDLLADAFMTSESLNDVARKALDAYDEFLGLLNDPEARARLKALHPEHADSDALFGRVRELGRHFQSGLTALFFRDRSTPYPELIEAYGVF